MQSAKFNFLAFNNLERKKRNKPTPVQSKALEKAFQEDNKPSREIKLGLSKELGLSLSSVQIWFQNRRAKLKNLERGYRPPRRPAPPALPKFLDAIPVSRRRFQLPSLEMIRPTQHMSSDPHLYRLQ
ncbi:hypothetical protein DSO57_1016276 [Entomophthora muscae]|uniref:Uncharacterized protein n=1 Tax=Entomophthora muscae TaxID=34485 RepID=A0ACC2SHZ5_9FUNG|nr:hypothetical protein DSO57_1016276 [Entomophthora muscae]